MTRPYDLAQDQVQELLDAARLFRNEPRLERATGLRKTPGFAALVEAWEALSEALAGDDAPIAMPRPCAPGPWRVGSSNPDPRYATVVASNGQIVADLSGRPETVAAHARIIASLPRMLDQLRIIATERAMARAALAIATDALDHYQHGGTAYSAAAEKALAQIADLRSQAPGHADQSAPALPTIALSEDTVRNLVRDSGLDWHLGIGVDGEPNRYEQLVRATINKASQTGLRDDDTVIDSPIGPGKITGFSARGYPQVNHITVARLKRADGFVFDPHGSYAKDTK